MKPDAAVILATLEAAADRGGDPSALIYAQLFDRHPQFERLFLMDRDGGVRASMVQQAFECIIDFVGEDLTATSIIAASRQHHAGYGVPDDLFGAFFDAIHHAVRITQSDDWTPASEHEWRLLANQLRAIGGAGDSG